jgi:hypothetical protein
VVLVRVPGKLIEKFPSLQSADTIGCGIATSELDSQCSAQASTPEAAGGRRRTEAIQQRNSKVWKFCKEKDAISILWSSVRGVSMVEYKDICTCGSMVIRWSLYRYASRRSDEIVKTLPTEMHCSREKVDGCRGEKAR